MAMFINVHPTPSLKSRFCSSLLSRFRRASESPWCRSGSLRASNRPRFRNQVQAMSSQTLERYYLVKITYRSSAPKPCPIILAFAPMTRGPAQVRRLLFSVLLSFDAAMLLNKRVHVRGSHPVQSKHEIPGECSFNLTAAGMTQNSDRGNLDLLR